MKAGIIGAAAMGQILAGKLIAGGHTVKIANSRGPESLKDDARRLGATPVTVSGAVVDVEIVFIAIPTRAVPNLPKGLFEGAADDLVVVDLTNSFPWRDGHIAAFDIGVPESEWVSEQIGRPVVKLLD